MHSGDLDLPVRIAEQRGHRLGEYRSAVAALCDPEAGIPPYRRVHVRHQHQECFANTVGNVGQFAPSAQSGRHHAPDTGIGMAGMGQEGLLSA